MRLVLWFWRRPFAPALLGALMVFGASSSVTQPARADETVVACQNQPNLIFKFYRSGGVQGGSTCPGGSIQLLAQDPEEQGVSSIWQASAPTGLYIVSASASLSEEGVNAGNSGDYGGDFYWGNGVTASIVPNENTANFLNIYTTNFGFNLVCGKSPCRKDAEITVYGVTLVVREYWYEGTLDSPSGLWQSSGWIRGTWPFVLSGDSPSGICRLVVSLAGQPLPGSASAPNPAVWHQCNAPAINEPINTANYPDGVDELAAIGYDAAGNAPQAQQTVDIDNQQPTVTLLGNNEAPSTAGTQHVTALTTAGPSGVAGISCSVDGGPVQWYPGSATQIPVTGVGEHSVRCTAQNRALDAAGNPGVSDPQTFNMKIATPTLNALSFDRIADALHCQRATKRVKIPAKWVTIHRHHKPVWVKRRARVRVVKVTRCRPQTKVKRVIVRVQVRQHGKKVWVKRVRRERVVLVPHVVGSTRKRIGHGKTTTVSGWLGTSDGAALGGQTVDVLTAPDNGKGNFSFSAVATTAANGGWTATLPAGPSRLIEAIYNGGATTESSLSGQVRLTVPAKVRLVSITPRNVPWGGTVVLKGRLLGGYLPAGGALVRLRIGAGKAETTYGVRAHVTGSGRFSTRYTFGVGEPAIHRSYWFQLQSLPTGNYPYAPGTSRRLTVHVGGHP